MNKINVLLAASLLWGCQASTTGFPVAIQGTPRVPPKSTAVPLALEGIHMNLPVGASVGKLQAGLLCVNQGPLKLGTKRLPINGQILNSLFRKELGSLNYDVVGDPDVLIGDRSANQAPYLIEGLVTQLEANVCFPIYGAWGKSSGSSRLSVEWSIYRTLDHQIVLKIRTQGSYDTGGTVSGGGVKVVEGAFAVAVRNLLAKQSFYSLIVEDVESPPQFARKIKKAPTDQTRKVLLPLLVDYSSFERGSKKDSLDLDEVLHSVVSIRSSNSLGSGFLISSDGFILTNEHVIRGVNEVKVILQNGLELVGHVLRSNSERDVALIRVPVERSHRLALSPNKPRVGEDVYAVGTPLLEGLQGTVSKGIVSAIREINGLAYIQSDTNIQPGNSGGPLVNDGGYVIGITVSGLSQRGNLLGLNFFIPIKEALEGLNIQRTETQEKY